MTRAFGIAVLAVVIASGIPATAHHSNPHYFDMAKAMTLEGAVLRVRVDRSTHPSLSPVEE